VTEGQRAVTVQFEPAAMLKVSVAGYRGSTAEGSMTIGVRRDEASVGGRRAGRWGTSHPIGADGSMTLGPTEAGRYVLTLHATAKDERNGASTSAVSHTPVVLQAGENYVTLVMPDLHALVVRVPDGTTKDRIQIDRRDRVEPRLVFQRGPHALDS